MSASRRLRWLPRAGLLLVALAGLLGTTEVRPSVAQETAWSAPESLGRYWFPNVTTDDQGRAHIAWSGGGDGYDTVMYSVWTPESGLSDVVDIQAQATFQGSEASRPLLFVDPEQTVHMSFRFTSLHYSAAPADAVLRPQAWSGPEDMADAGYFTIIEADSTGVLHYFSTQNVPEESCRICLHLYHQTSFDNGASWDDPIDISLITAGTAKPQLVRDAEDGLHLVYESGYGGTLGQLSGPTEVRYVRSLDGGMSWLPPVVLGVPLEEGQRPQSNNIAIDIDKSGKLVVIWLDRNRDAVYYRLSDDRGETWSDPAPVSGVFSPDALYKSTLDSYTLAADSAGNLHLGLVGRLSGEERQLRVLHLVWDGGGWSSPETIAAYEGDAPEWPRFAVGGGNRLHAVWFVRNEEGIFRSEDGAYLVYYANRLVDAPEIAPALSLPTPTSPPAPAGMPSIDQPSANLAPESEDLLSPPPPLPTESQRAPGGLAALQSISSENDDLLYVLAAVAPAALILIALVAMQRARLRRRP